ncbi:DNA polymerase III subunit gamma/tau [uncultured Thermanaerothrix sp.]|uniref:DNA polymerase III subunit gamma/tau n=1 Tax=uncultured Thermanaerothrix sp. TaxID=1195149 RepID=UPI00260ACFE1|nr:DNA polymerase III subunit gamma/tau [uncultured Thermanaerothrix sp.]
MPQALYRKWRPRLWEQVIGQEHVVQTLRNAVRSGRIAHAYLFAGPRGTGKTTTARLLAKALNCLHPDPAQRPCDQCGTCQAVNEGRFLDLIEIDAASNTSVDDVRDLRDKINLAPGEGRYKVYIIDEVHMLSTAAFNALLKTLEEPPPHAIFILATTEIHKIPPTVLSRCQRFEFRRIPLPKIVGQLKALAQQEGIEAEEEALTLIARQATGSLRDAISLFDQLAASGQALTLTAAQALLGTATDQRVMDLIEALLQHEATRGLQCIHQAMENGVDARQFARQVVDYLRNLMLIVMDSTDQIEATPEQRSQMTNHARRFTLPYLMHAIQQFNQAATETRSTWHPTLLLELALAQTLAFIPQAQPATPLPASAGPTPLEPVAPPPFPASAPTPKRTAEQAPAASTPPTGSDATTPRPVSTPAASAPPFTDASSKATPENSSLPAASAENLPDTRKVLQNWARIRAIVKSRRTQTEALLNSCKVVQVHHGALVLGFATELLKSKMETDENIALTRAAVRQVLGVDLPIVCTVVGTKATSLPEDFGIEPDGMVSTALSLGAKIVKKETNPTHDQE